MIEPEALAEINVAPDLIFKVAVPSNALVPASTVVKLSITILAAVNVPAVLEKFCVPDFAKWNKAAV